MCTLAIMANVLLILKRFPLADIVQQAPVLKEIKGPFFMLNSQAAKPGNVAISSK